jgi:predicted extracellular nuclease
MLPAMNVPLRLVPLVLLAACAPATPPEVRALGAFACGAPHTRIAEIQGRGATSPLIGSTQDVEGVVVGDFVTGLGGIFIQDPLHLRVDVSGGLFIELERRPEGLRAGMQLRVRGLVTELGPDHGTLTAIVAPEDIALCGEGPPISPRVLETPPADWEALEGMLVTLPGPLTVSGNYTLHRFGELLLAFGDRLYQPTELHPPGPQARALAEENARRSILVDDARSQQNPPSLWFLPETVDTLRVGSRVSGITGVVDQRFGSHRIQLSAPLGGVEPAPRPLAPPAVPGSLRVAAFNLENFFNGDGEGGGFPTERGAQTAAEFERQAAKLIAALSALEADIVALSELENDGYGEHSAIAELTRRLNAAPGEAGDWRFVDPGSERLGGDAIAVGLIYRASRVERVGRPAYREGGPFARGSRVPIAAAFRSLEGGRAFTVASVHLKSKTRCPEHGGPDGDQGDGQACWNASRVEAVRALHDWLSRDPAGSGGALWMIAGDFNAHGQEDPIRLLLSKGYLDAASAHVLPHRPYSYVFRGLAGRLDHVLLSPGLAPHLAGAGYWHINADEPPLLGYSGTDTRWYRPDPLRSSDHDPLIVGLDLQR